MAQTPYRLSIHIGDGNADSANFTNSFNNNFYGSDEDERIGSWLSLIEPNDRHQGVQTDRVPGIGDWLLETDKFREWRGGAGGAHKAVLFCYGNPGVGKTYLSSLVIDSLCDQAKKENTAVACLYCGFLAQQEMTATNMMGAILRQLVCGRGIPKDLRQAFQEGKKEVGGRRLQHAGLMRMLKIAIAPLPQVFICIDALDRCPPRNLPKLLESLRDLVRESPKARVFLTGRPHAREATQRYITETVVISISPNTDDIRSFLETRLERDDLPEAMDKYLYAEIVQVILDKMSDTFLLVSLHMEAILGEVTISQRRKRLEAIVQDTRLSDAYTAALTRLKGQKGNKSLLGLKVLMWVLYSERPLRVDELCHAMGVEIGSVNLDPKNVPQSRTLLSSCLGLATVEESSSTVRLVHFTLQEHLLNNPTLFHSPHSNIAEVCLTYLNFQCIMDLPPTLDAPPPTMPLPLLEYASRYWGDHTRQGMTKNIKILALKLLDRFDQHISARQLLLHRNRDRCPGPYFRAKLEPTGFTGLHGASFLGIAGIVATGLEMKEWDVNARDCMGITALTWAAIKGHEEVVKMFLEREDVNPNQADTRNGRTPLLWAAMHGHDRVVKMLLGQKDTNLNQADTKYGRTPFWWAVRNGHDGVAKILLEREDVNPEQADTEGGRTPLLWAVRYGSEGVVKTLLERKDVNPDQVDPKDGQTPLLWAVRWGPEEVVKMLLERKDLNPDQAVDEDGRTPLLWAVRWGCVEVAIMLLGREDVNLDQVDPEDGRTPLLWAVRWGRVEIVKMLLEREDANPDLVDPEDGRTPLLWAVRWGRVEVVKMLLEREDANPDQADPKDGRTPLLWAVRWGRVEVVRMLLGREDVNPNLVEPEDGRTPLEWAVRWGPEEVVKMLLERKDLNPDQVVDEDGRTPLLWAVRWGRVEVAIMLLERDDVNLDQVDPEDGRTPLLWAVRWGRVEVVKMILEREDANLDQGDPEDGRTPLEWAVRWGREEVVKMLLERRTSIPPR